MKDRFSISARSPQQLRTVIYTVLAEEWNPLVLTPLGPSYTFEVKTDPVTVGDLLGEIDRLRKLMNGPLSNRDLALAANDTTGFSCWQSSQG